MVRRMRTLMAALMSVLLLAGCGADQELQSIERGNLEPSVWVFAQINVPAEEDELESYYYFARVSRALYDDVSQNKLEQGFALLREVHYWDNDDRIRAYRDEADEGELVFRIEDIRKLTLLRRGPVVGLDSTEFEALNTAPVEVERRPTPKPAKADSAQP